MNINKVFKEHFRIILFGIIVTVITVYLGVDTLTKETKPGLKPPVVAVPDPGANDEEEVVEPGEEAEPEEEVPTDPSMPEEGEQIVGEVFEENRPKFNTTSVAEIDGHKKIVSNEYYDLYLKEENLSIILRNQKTGALLYSTVEKPDKTNEKWSNFVKSGVVIDFLQDTNIVYYQADMYSENPDKKVTLTDTGFNAHVSYPGLEISYNLEVSLKDDVLNVHIPKDSIIETSDKYKVANVYVYPMMGYTKVAEDDGYMFVPDGSGSLIHYKDHKGQFKQPFNQMIYGSNSGIDESYVLSLLNGQTTVNENKGIIMPVFGSIHSDKDQGFVGVINEGDESARLFAYPNGAVTPYNWITPSFVYRQFYNQLTSATTGTMVIRQKDKNNFNIDVSYHLLSGDDATYVGMAKTYKETLETQESLLKKDVDYKTRVDFLGGEVKSGLLSKQDIIMTTFHDARAILDTLATQGVNDTLSVYKGWQKGGKYTSLPLENANMSKKLGDLSVLKDLDENQRIILEADLLRYNPATNPLNSSSLVKQLNKRTYDENVHGKVYQKFNYIIPEESVGNAKTVVRDIKGMGFESISVEGIGEKLYSYLLKNQTQDRIHTASIYSSIFEDMREAEMYITSASPHSIYWQYHDSILDLQVESSNYVFVGEEVPFLPIVLKGSIPYYAPYINFNANHEAYVLNMIEYGAYPSFIVTQENASHFQLTNSSGLYSTQFDLYEEQIVEYDKIFKDIANEIGTSEIVDHIRDGKSVTVSYSNGVKILLNYASADTIIDGVNVKAMSYEVVK